MAEHNTLISVQPKLRLKNLTVMLAIGILPHERQQPQPVCFDVEVTLKPQPLIPVADDITQVLDYRLLHQAVKQLEQQLHTDLLETVVGKLAQQLVSLPQVARVRVCASKTQIFADCTVELELDAVSI